MCGCEGHTEFGTCKTACPLKEDLATPRHQDRHSGRIVPKTVAVKQAVCEVPDLRRSWQG